MIITCPCDKKKFNVDASLIPSEGRLLKCSSCGHKWYYKLGEKNSENILKNKDIKIKKINPNEKIPSDIDKIILEAEQDKIQKVIAIDKSKSNISFFNLLILFFITFVAFIIFLDTFKNPINNMIPGFNFLLENFYESIQDLYLFFKDLIR